MELNHARELIRLREERLHILEEREATFGPLHVPPEVVIEIRQSRMEIGRLREQLQRETIRDLALDDEQPERYPGLMLLIGTGRIDQDALHQSARHAIKYHLPRLRHCWLIGSGGDHGSLPVAHEFGRICEQEGVTPHIWHVTDAFSIQETYDIISRLYTYEIPASTLDEQSVIADLTGATKPMSIGMLLACGLHRPMQYMVRQQSGASQPILLRYTLHTSGGTSG